MKKRKAAPRLRASAHTSLWMEVEGTGVGVFPDGNDSTLILIRANLARANFILPKINIPETELKVLA